VLDRASTQGQKIDAWWYLSEITSDANQVREYMEKAYVLEVPLVAEVAVGPNWRDME